MARLRLKRQLLDALAEVAKFASPEGMVEQEFARSGSAWKRIARRGGWTTTTRDKDEETLKADYRAIAERRVRLGLLLARDRPGEQHHGGAGRDDPGDARGGDALPGQEQQVFEFFRQNPRATETLRGPISRRRWSTSFWSWRRWRSGRCPWRNWRTARPGCRRDAAVGRSKARTTSRRLLRAPPASGGRAA